MHFAVDFAGTLAVMAGLGLTALGHPRADAIAALFVAVLVVFGAVRLARSNVNALMDSAPAGAEANLRAVVASLPGVTEVRALRVRSSGGKYFADVVIGVDRLAGLERSHAVMDEVERVVEQELGGPAEVSVHAEPLAADERPSERALAAALRVPGVIEVHNATVLMRPGGRAITLHARVDAGLPLREAARITQRLRDEIRRETGAADVYIHLEPHAPGVAAAFDVTGPARRPLRARGRSGAARRGRARGGARVRPRRPLRRRAAGARRARAVGRATRTRSRAGSRRRCARRSTSSRRSWSRWTRDGRARACGRPARARRRLARAHAGRRRGARGLVAADRRRARARLRPARRRARGGAAALDAAAARSPATTTT